MGHVQAVEDMEILGLTLKLIDWLDVDMVEQAEAANKGGNLNIGLPCWGSDKI